MSFRSGSDRSTDAGRPSGAGTPNPNPTAPSRTASRAPASTRRPAARPAARQVPRQAPPVLVRQLRGSIVESQHRGSIVQVSASGAVRRVLGDGDGLVNLRSAVKPFGLVALVVAGGIEEFELSPAELAVMAGSHSGEDLHVRTLQAVFRRAGLTQQLLECGSDGAPLDALTAARLARDGERVGALRHMCSGQHTALLLLCKMRGWPFEGYGRPEHPVQRLCGATVALAFGTTPDRLVISTDACGIPTYGFALRDVARAYAFLADPQAVGPDDPRRPVSAALSRVGGSMSAHPELVGGTRDRLDTSLMKAAPGRLIAKGGAEGLRAFAIRPLEGAATRAEPSGIAIKIEDGGGFERASWAASVETLRQANVLDAAALRALARYHRPKSLDSHGTPAAEAIPEFDLAPVGELV